MKRKGVFITEDNVLELRLELERTRGQHEGYRERLRDEDDVRTAQITKLIGVLPMLLSATFANPTK